jgi:hypothetical protein
MAARAHQADKVSLSMEERAQLAALGYHDHGATPSVVCGASTTGVRDNGFALRLSLALIAVSLAVVVFFLIAGRYGTICGASARRAKNRSD